VQCNAMQCNAMLCYVPVCQFWELLCTALRCTAFCLALMRVLTHTAGRPSPPQVALCLSQLRAARELCLERVASGEGTVESWGGDGATSLDARQLAEDLQVCCSVVKAFETEVGGGTRSALQWLLCCVVLGCMAVGAVLCAWESGRPSCFETVAAAHRA
jgi:hypothetical protein